MSALSILSKGFANVESLLAAADDVGVPLWIAVAMIEKETSGLNVYGNDAGGVFSTPGAPDIQVTEENYKEFERRVLAGERSNGVGPAQITHPDFIRDAKARGIRLWVPRENIAYGVGLLARYLNGRFDDASIIDAGRRYNGALAYGEHLASRANYWRNALEQRMALPRNNGTPSGIALLEVALRRERPEWAIKCGPSMAGKACVRGKHGHLWTVENGRVVAFSTHYVDANGGATGRHVGGALDLSNDPPGGGAISVYETAHGDDLARDLIDLGYGVIWGVAQHFDHPHVDYRRQNTNVKYNGVNYPFRVSDITRVQTNLAKVRRSNSKPYYAGRIDGLREAGTRQAIVDFQRAHGLKPDGDPGALTEAAIAKALQPQAAPSGPDYSRFTTARIIEAQNLLKQAGWYVGVNATIDGKPGPRFQSAMKTAQEHLRKVGLYKDEIDLLPGPNFIKAISAHLTPPKNPAVPTSRHGGNNRFHTSVVMGRVKYPTKATTVYLAGVGTPDLALAWQVATDGPVLLITPGNKNLPVAVKAEIERLKPKKIVALGGPATITPEVLQKAAEAAAS